ncbi:MAG: SPOR domain-containing protein [Thermoleophilia bacterium]|nr:SPOR domain-containing protein [Thermoleophilia bacterium]
MTDAFDPGHLDSSIGVGMGGSCPNCRAPVDLGQEFCLECGAAIRFTGRQRKAQQPAGGTSERPVAAAPAPRNRFPWVPFAIVLILVVAGVAFALLGGDGSGSKSKGPDATSAALPSITNSTTTTTSATQTSTLENCNPDRPLGGTQPAVNPNLNPSSDPGAFQQTEAGSADTPAASGQFPKVDGQDSGVTDATGTDTTRPATADAATITVDENGAICPATDTNNGSTGTPAPDATTDPANPAATTPTPATQPATTTPTATTPAPTPAAGADDWPAGKNGWTVIVAGYKDDEQKARTLAADLKQNGFESGVLESSSYPSLCPGFWVTFSGYYPNKPEAEAHQERLSAKSYQNTYTREVRRTGAAASGCSS